MQTTSGPAARRSAAPRPPATAMGIARRSGIARARWGTTVLGAIRHRQHKGKNTNHAANRAAAETADSRCRHWSLSRRCDTFCTEEVTCNTRGKCSRRDGRCSCDRGFAAPNCRSWNSLQLQHSSSSCSCKLTWSGAASRCATGHYGADCQACDPATTCSGHGTCGEAGGCVCGAGFFTASCAVECTATGRLPPGYPRNFSSPPLVFSEGCATGPLTTGTRDSKSNITMLSARAC